VNSVASVPVRDAVVLAAGNGDRFQNTTRRSKLLQPLLGQPLIVRTLATAADAGIRCFHVVIGYQAGAVRAVVERGLPTGTTVQFTVNPDWHLENGVSVLAVQSKLCDRRFALLMGDHVFEPAVLRRLLKSRVGKHESILAVDTREAAPHVADEATKVRLSGDRITAIGKGLSSYDALDTGLFVCAPALFDALEVSRRAGDTTLSGGIRELASRGLMRAVHVGAASWCDIDTLDDLAAAERLLSDEPEQEIA
jgi:1L-myo-inositol 1-phosphate cytidylyltransferase / CDP-L-myo-inositol myo-inositolphosphotransferase